MVHDPGLERLLDLNGLFAEIGGGYWVKIEARRVPVDSERPHGISYSLTMHASDGARIFGIDNAHLVRPGRGPAGKGRARRDHLHRRDATRPYLFRDADGLIDDFWREVSSILHAEGIE